MWIFRIVFVFIILAGIQIYFFRKTNNYTLRVFPSIPKRKKRAVLYSILTIYNLYPFVGLVYSIKYMISGSSDFINLEQQIFDYILLYPFWGITVFIGQVTLFFLLTDLLKLVTFPLWKRKREKLRKYEARILIILVLIFLFYVPIRLIYDRSIIDTTYYTYESQNLNDELDGLNIALIADVQVDRFTNGNFVDEFIDIVNKNKPDIVLIAGDVITRSPNYINKSAEFLGKINSKYGVYSCVGDHDNWAYRGDYNKSLTEVKAALDSVNIKMIDNNNLTLNINNARVGITFITDNYVHRISPIRLDSLAEANNLDFKIFLTHQPNQRMVDQALKL